MHTYTRTDVHKIEEVENTFAFVPIHAYGSIESDFFPVPHMPLLRLPFSGHGVARAIGICEIRPAHTCQVQVIGLDMFNDAQSRVRGHSANNTPQHTDGEAPGMSINAWLGRVATAITSNTHSA